MSAMFFLYYCFFTLYGLIVAVSDGFSFARGGTIHMIVAAMSVFGVARATASPNYITLVNYFGHSFCFGALFCYLFLGIGR
ncbi:hypothetical protein N7541_006437 [Penicillium brevicompactum]|uniref:Uncharacterized protein n=1 Tax=Penicillium brevicompactum TaxID=5074 RepID=A0A9W9UQJ8_PENBR|nr:hypothetical protein N7541_006437 [Penicillium brevicompactum]